MAREGVFLQLPILAQRSAATRALFPNWYRWPPNQGRPQNFLLGLALRHEGSGFNSRLRSGHRGRLGCGTSLLDAMAREGVFLQLPILAQRSAATRALFPNWYRWPPNQGRPQNFLLGLALRHEESGFNSRLRSGRRGGLGRVASLLDAIAHVGFVIVQLPTLALSRADIHALFLNGIQ